MTGKARKVAGQLAVAAGALLMAASARADIILNMGVTGGSGDVQNVLLTNTDGNGTNIVTGELNQSADIVVFTGTESLSIQGGGQARIEANDGAFDYVEIMFQDSQLGFEKIQFNIDAASNGFADITFTDDMGGTTQFQNVALSGNGQNFFTGLSTMGEIITLATISTTVSMTAIDDLQQVRLGVANVTPPPPPVDMPVPGGLALLGIGALGLCAVKRKQNA